ncbi:MAG: polysaccharide biosynthesis protein [Nannocystis sp.]|nr:oligosaccharide flippase family protein [Nannocystis sp.]MBA3546052.1 polysaccharide biosynthesis protein [Nannocystis sp.]
MLEQPTTSSALPTEGSQAAESSRAATEHDALHLRRSLSLNLVGYAIKLVQPFLLIAVIRLYGPGAYGVFTLVQAILTVLMRLTLLGLDKGLLWWIPRQSPADERLGLRAVVAWTMLSSSLIALATALVLAPTLAAWAERPDITESLRWMVTGLIAMVLMEVFSQAAAGKRNLEAHVLFKNGLVTVMMPAAAIVFYFAGMSGTGLALSFFVAQALGLAGVLWSFRRVFRGSQWSGPRWALPPALWRYSWPMWLSELLLAMFQRLDVFVLAALTDEVAVGIFVGAATYAANITSIRVSFDPMVFAMVASIHHANDRTRLRRSFAHAWLMVATLQIPLTALMLAGAAWIMPLLGPKYAAGVEPAIVLIALYSVHGLFGGNQHIVSGFGRSGLTVINMLAALAIGTLLLSLLIPPYGVTGAAWGIGLTYVALNAIWAAEARIITGGWHYERSIAEMLALTGVAGGAAGLTWIWLAPWLTFDGFDGVARVAALAVFAAIFTPGMLALRRRAKATAALGDPLRPIASAAPKDDDKGARR